MLRKVTLEITVLDYDRIGGSDPIGKVRLGYSRKKLEKKHWAEMVENPRRPVIHWHVLQVFGFFLNITLILGTNSLTFQEGGKATVVFHALTCFFVNTVITPLTRALFRSLKIDRYHKLLEPILMRVHQNYRK